MNALKPRKAFIKDELNIDRLTPIQWDGIIRAMDKYAKHYHETMQANEFEKPQKQCTLPVVSVPLHVIKQVLKYCEDNQIYDKLGSYQNFYYKLNQIRRECEEGNAR